MQKLLMLLVLLLTPLTPNAAQAHAFLDHATPLVGSTVPTAPHEVVLTFTQNLEPAFSTAQVTDSSSARVDQGKAQVSGNTMTHRTEIARRPAVTRSTGTCFRSTLTQPKEPSPSMSAGTSVGRSAALRARRSLRRDDAGGGRCFVRGLRCRAGVARHRRQRRCCYQGSDAACRHRLDRPCAGGDLGRGVACSDRGGDERPAGSANLRRRRAVDRAVANDFRARLARPFRPGLRAGRDLAGVAVAARS